MYELCIRESKELPSFSGSDAYLVKLTLNGLMLDTRLLAFIKKIGDERQEPLSTDDFLVIDALFHEKPLNDNLRARLKHLARMGIIEHSGRQKYVLARGLYEATGKAGVHTRLVGLDRDTNKELILKHIRRNGEKGTPFRELEQVLPSHSRNQIKVLLRELFQADLIYAIGKTSAAKWFAR